MKRRLRRKLILGKKNSSKKTKGLRKGGLRMMEKET